MTENEPLPLNTFPSKKRFVIFSRAVGIVSEHDVGEDAVKAFAKFVAITGETGAIFRRERLGWAVH